MLLLAGMLSKHYRKLVDVVGPVVEEDDPEFGFRFYRSILFYFAASVFYKLNRCDNRPEEISACYLDASSPGQVEVARTAGIAFRFKVQNFLVIMSTPVQLL